jgi:sugar diacid utilization regulator/putative methionine-R-sulfoxide reductase with GAF domain
MALEVLDSRGLGRRASPSESAPGIPADAFEALFEIGQAVQAEVVDLDRVLALVVRKTSQLLQADVAWVALLDESNAEVHVVESWGAQHPDFARMGVMMGAGLGGVALREKETIVVEDYAEYTAGTPDVVHNTMQAEGVISVMCAPMLRGSTMVGALYAANRRRTRFRAEHVSLLSTVATQVSSAIRHAQMFQELEGRNELLEQSFSVHRELTGIGLREAGLEGIADALARVVDAHIVVEQEVVPPFRQEHGTVAASPDGEPLVVPISAGDRALGQITVSPADLSELQVLALDHGATVIALELLKQRTARDVEWRLRGELLEELLETSGAISATLAERAERLGVDLRTPRRIVALEAEGGNIDYGELLAIVRSKAGRRLHSVEGSVLAVKRGSTVVLAMAEVAAEAEEAILEDIRAAVAARGASLSVGLSRPGVDFAAAQREATACLRLSQRSGGSKSVVRSSDLGPLRFVLGSSDLAHANEMVLHQLGPLLEHDAECKSPLLPTLRAYLDANGHQPTVAAKCFIHVSTLKYRLKKIRDLLDGELSDPEVGFHLRLAFKLMDLLDSLGVEVTYSKATARRVAADPAKPEEADDA